MSKIGVLLADDNGDVLDVVTRLLAPEFHVVGAVTDGKALLSAADLKDTKALLKELK